MPSHKDLSNWYAQLGQHLEAGILLTDALRLCEGMPSQGRHAMANRLEKGERFCEVMATAPKWLPSADRQFMIAGMETASLPRTLNNLANRHASIGATQMKLVLGLVYPIGVLHLAAMLLPLAGMIDYESGFHGDPVRIIGGSARIIVPIWMGILLVAYLARSDHPSLPRLLRSLPILRTYSHAQSLADLAYSLGTFIAAGVPVPSAWRLASRQVNDLRFHKVVAALEATFAAGGDPSPELRQFKCLPADFIALYRTGAESGTLDANLLRIGQQYQERANRTMTLATLAYTSLLFALVAAVVIWTIFRVFGGYLQFFDSMAG